MIKANTTRELHIYRCGATHYVLLLQNARRAICTCSLTSELVDSRRLIIVLDRSETLGFVFFEDMDVDIRRGDSRIARNETQKTGDL